MKKGAILEQVKIDQLGWGGVGITKAPNGKKILIKGALPDSVVDIQITKKKRSYLTASIIHIHSVDKQRVDGEVVCPHYAFSYTHTGAVEDVHADPDVGCGGCKRQVVSYPQQLKLKQDLLAQCFHDLDIELSTILPSPKALGYRNKIEFSFGKYLVKAPKDSKSTTSSQDSGSDFAVAEHWQLGFHQQGAFSKIVNIDQCYLVSPVVHAVYELLKSYLEDAGLPVYDPKQHQGVLRHLMIREGVHTGDIMVVLSYAGDQMRSVTKRKQTRHKMLQHLKTNDIFQEHITTFVLIDNNDLADIVNGKGATTEILRGDGVIFEELILPLADTASSDTQETEEYATSRFQISPFSFFQTNTRGAQVLFAQAQKMLGAVRGNIVDLYCGSGTIGIAFLKAGIGQAVKGVEIVASATADARHNAKLNGVADRAQYYTGKAEHVLLGKDTGHADPADRDALDNFFIGDDVVIVDPPRDGLHPKVVDFLIELQTQKSFRLLYISCNPTTMARDMERLLAGGYRTSRVQPVDMFPQTHHVECISVLHTSK